MLVFCCPCVCPGGPMHQPDPACWLQYRGPKTGGHHLQLSARISSSIRGQVTRHGKFRHRSTDDPLRGNVTDPKYWPPRDRLMHLLLWPGRRHSSKGEEKDTNGLISKRKSVAHFICVKRPGSSAKRRRSGNYNRKYMGKLF